MDIDLIKTNIKRFFSNPNTLTFFLVIAMIIIVYVVYSFMVNRAIRPVSVPYSTTLIKGTSEITADSISTVKITGNFLTASGDGLLQSTNQILGRYVGEGYQIPPHSFFYSETLVDSKTAQEAPQSKIPDGYTIFALDVDFHSTYGCSIMPGNYIDLWFKAKSDDGESIFEKFIESIQVTKVVDSQGKDVFAVADDETEPKPSKLYFVVPDYYNSLLKTALLISSNSIEIIPVPRNTGYSENPKETSIANEAVEAFILSKSAYITH